MRLRLPRRAGSVLLPVSGLALALAFLAADSAHRIRGIQSLSAFREGYAPMPARDSASPSGFEAGQHRLILPSAGTDGYPWILQTEAMLAGEGVRIRHTTADNAPHGREVHWSSLPRWWLASLARARTVFRPQLTPPQALEQVAAGAGAMALALFLVSFTPLLAWRLGPLPASLFAASWVAVFPLYEMFAVGIVDHHGFAAAFVFACLAFLLIGGGGWVRTGVEERSGALPLPKEASARRWFVASGVAGGLGLWVSAISVIPVLLGTAVGALVASRRAHGRDEAVRTAPGVWRLWGMAGCVTSLACYALEYAPTHLGMRLEVNHPLYALSWAGGGALLARAWRQSGGPGQGAGMTRGAPYRDGPRVAVALLLASSPAVVVLATGGESFRLADPFLRAVHTDHIREFQGLARHLAGASWLQVLQSVSALPLVLLPAGALLWRSPGAGAGGRALRALGAGMAVVGIAFVLVSSQAGVTTLLDAAGLRSSGSPLVRLAPFGAGAAAALLAFVLLFLGWWRDTPSPAPEDALRIATVGGAGTALSALALLQVRWLPTAAAALLALLLALVALGSPAGAARRGTRATRVAFLLLVIVPFPLLTTVLLWRSSEYATGMEAPQVVARDVAYRLRAGASGRDVVVAAPPVTTTWLVYFGGFRGLGTLYWENLEGLRVTAALGSVRGEVEARELLARHGVTHLIVPSWERFPVPTCSRDPRDACRLGSGARRAEEPTFLERALNSEALPDWLVPISYEPPAVPALTGVRVRIFEVRANPGTGS